jgi:uncharacterized protein YutE (UPF0331/DUF86 family)
MNDIVLNKAQIIERALNRVTKTYARHREDLDSSLDAQDVIVLNLQRACEAAIDLAMHLVRLKNLGLPQESRDAFTLLQQNGVLSLPMADKLKKMVSFRNVAVHNYRDLDWAVVRSIVEKECDDLRHFAELAIKNFASEGGSA